MSTIRRWQVLGGIGLVLLAVAGWFLLISPKQSEAADLRTQTEEQVAANEQTRLRIARLRAQAAELPAQRALLASIQRQLPNTPALPTLIRDLAAAARAGNVQLVSLAPTAPAPMQLTAPTPVAPPEGDTGGAGDTGDTGDTPTGGAAEETPTAAATPPAAPAANLFRIEVALTVEGSYFDVQRFLGRTEMLDRTMLVTSFTLNPGGSGDGASGQPTTGVRQSPQLSAVIQGQVFVSPTLGVVAPGAVPPGTVGTPTAPGATPSAPAAAVGSASLSPGAL